MRRVGAVAWWLGVPSAGRPHRVATQQRLLGPCTWYVPADQADAYREAGAQSVRPVADPWPAARNAVLADAHQAGLPAVQVDDDLRRVTWVDPAGSAAACSPTYAMAQLVRQLRAGRIHLVGAAPTTNIRFARGGGVRTNLFCRSGLTATHPAAYARGLRYDPALPLKEDYDWCLQHLAAYGTWARHDSCLPDFAQRTKVGGCADLRTPEREAEAAAYLVAKWPGWVRLHPRRGPTEVLLSAPRPA